MPRKRPIRNVEALGALVGLAGLIGASVDGAARARADRERAAKAAFLEWLNLAFQHPEFSDPDLAATIHGKAIPNDKVLFERYQWFVAIFLNTAEEIFRLTHGRPGWAAWKTVLSDQIEFHAPYLKGPWRANEYDGHYSPGFSDFIQSVLDGARVKAWPKNAPKAESA